MKKFNTLIKRWHKEEDATALMEAVMILPILVTLLMGMFDLGFGIALNQKTITASQIASDLISRNKSVEMTDVENIIDASELTFEPYNLNGFGIDIVSIEFDENSDPQILWRETRDMSPNDTAVNSTIGLGAEGEGMVIVTVRYSYNPYFTGLFTDSFNLEEVAFSRGRRSPTVTWGT
ncbi:MAG: TadE/TadG family type IV pilus assembly protein [Bdellovibrionales bacterium]